MNDKNKNKQFVDVINSQLIDLNNEIEKMSKDEIKTEKPYKIVDIVEKILKFNQRNEEGKGLKILTSNQMLRKLPVSLAQLMQKIIQKRLKTKSGKYCILCKDQKNLQNKSIKVRSTLFKKYGSNFYEH